ncbi:uncharacterized protein LOC125312865 [Rhodamnia argentea]|uniref:Uncharacterized protein LOC125312865 n=1 Tax=Rhodamnia argentea TaxID=178133 RepID=A0ABM3GVZ5_9MYRT|nr:uncharacterized protein LOC125312865 [Rhodamnia argentea]
MGDKQNLVAIILQYGGKFVTRIDELEYEGGLEGTIFVDALCDGLRFFKDDNGLRDIIYNYLHGEEATMYVEHDDSDEDEDDEGIETGEVGKEYALQEGQFERQERAASNVDQVQQKGRCPKVFDEDIDNEGLIGLDWEFAKASELED